MTLKQLIANLQKSYSPDVKSEPTIEIVDASVVLDFQSEPNLQNRVGNNAIPGKNNNDCLPTGSQTVEDALAQDATQWNLPENPKVRLCKGR